MHRRFVLDRREDETGVSGTGVVAEGVEFSDGTVALRWTSEWPTSVVFHERGIDAVHAVHGHGGKTQIEWLDKWHCTADHRTTPCGDCDGCRYDEQVARGG